MCQITDSKYQNKIHFKKGGNLEKYNILVWEILKEINRLCQFKYKEINVDH